MIRPKGGCVKFVKEYEDGLLFSVFVFIDSANIKMENKTGYKRRKKARSTLRGFDAVSKEPPQAERPITKLPGDDAFLIANVVDFCKEKKKKEFFRKNETDRHSNAFFSPEGGQQDAILHRGKVRQQSEIVSDTSKMQFETYLQPRPHCISKRFWSSKNNDWIIQARIYCVTYIANENGK